MEVGDAVAAAAETVTATEMAPAKGSVTRLVLKVKQKDRKKICWEEGVVDNEHMCKKSSKRK